jgi:hypothetical protein
MTAPTLTDAQALERLGPCEICRAEYRAARKAGYNARESLRLTLMRQRAGCICNPAPAVTKATVTQFLTDTEPDKERGKWQTLNLNRYTASDQHFWIAKRCKHCGETYEGMTEIVFLAVVILETPDGLELLPPDEEIEL